MNAPDVPNSIYIDPRTLTIFYEPGAFRIRYIVAKKQREKKHHPHYKTGSDVEMMKALANSGMSQKQIAVELGIQARTVRKYVGRVYQTSV